MTDVLLCWLILPKADRLPAAPTYPPPENPDTPTSEFLVADDSFLYWKTFDGISDNHLAGIKAGIETLWIYGYVDYIDKFQERHRGGYARVYEPGRGAGPPEQRNNLIFVSQRNYNYDRRRKKGEGNDW